MPADGPITRSPHVVYRELAGEGGGVLLHLESGAYHGLNEVGAAIWELIDGARTQEEIVALLRERLEDPPAEAALAAETERFLADLRERELIAG